MDGRCVFLFLSIFIVNFLSVTNEGKKLYIKDSLKVKPFDDRLEPKKLESIVVDALTARYKNRKMIDVSNYRYKFHMAWRGFKRFFTEKILNIFCPSIVRDLRTIKLLKEMVSNDDIIRNKLKFVLPFNNKSKSTKKGNKKEENSGKDSEEEENDEESDEESDEKSNQGKKQNKKPVKKGKINNNKKDSEEDDDDNSDDDDSDEDDSEEEKKSNPKTRKKSLDDLFK